MAKLLGWEKKTKQNNASGAEVSRGRDISISLFHPKFSDLVLLSFDDGVPCSVSTDEDDIGDGGQEIKISRSQIPRSLLIHDWYGSLISVKICPNQF